LWLVSKIIEGVPSTEKTDIRSLGLMVSELSAGLRRLILCFRLG
jgi:hypothetical protein